jgi:hypothetical protein
VENWPKRAISTLSPGFSVLVIAASQAAVPEPGKMKTSPRLGAQDALEVGKQAQRQVAEIGGAHVLHPDIHGAAHLVGHIGRPGNEQMGVTGLHRERLLLARNMRTRCTPFPFSGNLYRVLL